MTSDRALLERQMAEVELRPFTLEEFHHRRHQKDRNHRIATAVIGLALLGGAVAGVLRTLGIDDEKVESDVLGTLPSPFEGDWVSLDRDGSSQTLEIVRTGGDRHEIVIHDDSAIVCSGAPSTINGRGQVETVTKLVVAAELTCDDGDTPAGLELAALADLTFDFDPDSAEVVDSTGVVWRRDRSGPDTPPEDAGTALEGPSPYVGTWVVGRQGTYFPDSLEIRLVGGEDLHEVVALKAETPQCAGGPSTMSGTGRRVNDLPQHPGLVQLALVVDLTCDDGSTPVPQTPSEEGAFNDLAIQYIHDPVTDELKGSLGSLFVRQGAELAQGDPMPTVERAIDAVNARDADAYIELFAPDGGFEPRGSFSSDAIFVTTSQGISEASEVRAWMAIQEAWGFEAKVISCTSAFADHIVYDGESDGWIDCEVSARWAKLSLEITERWRFELRGERLVYWTPEPLDLDPSGRTLPLGSPGLEAWEAWLEANHADDAARWLTSHDDPRPWVIDGHTFSPSGLIPYDPAFADDIDASINEYLEEQ